MGVAHVCDGLITGLLLYVIVHSHDFLSSSFAKDPIFFDIPHLHPGQPNVQSQSTRRASIFPERKQGTKKRKMLQRAIARQAKLELEWVNSRCVF